MISETDLLADRYGRKTNAKQVNRRLVIGLAAVLIAIFVGWATWVTVDGANQVKSQDLAYEVLGPEQTSVRFSVSSPAGIAVCAIQVLNQSYAVVGYRELEISQSGEYEVLVNTTEPGVTGLVDKCWLK
jgi:MFS family permease